MNTSTAWALTGDWYQHRPRWRTERTRPIPLDVDPLPSQPDWDNEVCYDGCECAYSKDPEHKPQTPPPWEYIDPTLPTRARAGSLNDPEPEFRRRTISLLSPNYEALCESIAKRLSP